MTLSPSSGRAWVRMSGRRAENNSYLWVDRRTLRWVERLRRIVDEHAPAVDHDGNEQELCPGCGGDEEPMYAVDECPTKRHMATIWRDHPEFNEDWWSPNDDDDEPWHEDRFL